MNRKLRNRRAGILLTVAIIWGFTAGLYVVLSSGFGVNPAAADENPCNPVTPSAGAASLTAPGEDDSQIPWDVGNANPCNPGAAVNPCNPCGAVNPCNPCGAGQVSKVKLDYVLSYRGEGFARASGFVESRAHGDRLTLTYVSPVEAATIYRQNAELVRQGQNTGFQPYPAGTVIIQESFQKSNDGAPGSRGPFYAMTKEQPGYDTAGNDWRYGQARADLTKIGDGNLGNMRYCKSCHQTMHNQDFVFARDR